MISRSNPQIDFITCDAEGGSTQSIGKLVCITKNPIDICGRTNVKNVLIKSYASSPALVIAQSSLMNTIFNSVTCLRSEFSGYGSS